jgi:hypothetical protein
MPGETLRETLLRQLRCGQQGIGVLLTELGENVTDAAQADDVTRHYTNALAKIDATGLDCQIPMQLTQLGLDADADRCYDNVCTLTARAREHGTMVWIDMEQHKYVDATLALYRRCAHGVPECRCVSSGVLVSHRVTTRTMGSRLKISRGWRYNGRRERPRNLHPSGVTKGLYREPNVRQLEPHCGDCARTLWGGVSHVTHPTTSRKLEA